MDARGHQYFSQTRISLKVKSIAVQSIALLHKALVLRVLGEGDQALMHEVNQRLRLALGL